MQILAVFFKIVLPNARNLVVSTTGVVQPSCNTTGKTKMAGYQYQGCMASYQYQGCNGWLSVSGM